MLARESCPGHVPGIPLEAASEPPALSIQCQEASLDGPGGQDQDQGSGEARGAGAGSLLHTPGQAPVRGRQLSPQPWGDSRGHRWSPTVGCGRTSVRCSFPAHWTPGHSGGGARLQVPFHTSQPGVRPAGSLPSDRESCRAELGAMMVAGGDRGLDSSRGLGFSVQKPPGFYILNKSGRRL